MESECGHWNGEIGRPKCLTQDKLILSPQVAVDRSF
jgi:hypothetical protein